MPTAVIVGASVAGLSSALALRAAGYRAVVLERAAPPPEGPVGEASLAWHRPTVPQAEHSHTLTSLGVKTLRERAPAVLHALLGAGARLLDLTDALPPGASDRERRPGDDELVALGCRRTALELALYRAVRELSGVDIRHGEKADGVELDRAGRRARAVTAAGGVRVPADVIIDATGRRGAARKWLDGAGLPAKGDKTEPSGLSGFTRIYRRAGGAAPGPLGRGNAAGDIFDHYAGVLHPADNDTFSVAIAVLPGDAAASGLRNPDAFTAVARATPGIAPWLEGAKPLSPVYAITSPPNTLSGLATSQKPAVAGLFAVGDAACITNPLFGRGMSLALAHAFSLADLLAALPEPGEAQSRAAALAAEALFLPWYEHSAFADRERIARWREGAAPAPKTPRVGLAEAQAAARTDGVVWRGVMRVLMSLATPRQVFDEAFAERVKRAETPAPRPHAPSREDIARLIAGAKPALPRAQRRP